VTETTDSDNPFKAPPLTTGAQHEALAGDALQPEALQPEELQPATGIAWLFLDVERRLRTFWRLVLYILALVIAQIIVSIVVLVGAVIVLLTYAAASGIPVTEELFSSALKSHQVYFLLPSTLVLVAVSLPVTFLFRRFLDRRSAASMGFRTPPAGWLPSLGGGFAAGAAVMVAVTGIAYAAGAFTGGIGSPDATMLMWTIMLIFAAFFEEYVFRSYLLQNMIDAGRNGPSQRWFTLTAIVISSVLFWLAHSFNPGAWSTIWVGLNLFTAGVALSLCYMASGNVWFPTAVHFAWNFTQGLVLGVEVSGNPMSGLIKMQRVEGDYMELLNGGAFGMEGSPLGILASLLLCGMCMIMFWLKQPANSKAD